MRSFQSWRAQRPTDSSDSEFRTCLSVPVTGYLGWPEQSPFDGILVTAGAEHVPEPLVEQLKPGARMIIPVGDSLSFQILRVVEKLPGGEVEIRDNIAVRFVPFRRN